MLHPGAGVGVPHAERRAHADPRPVAAHRHRDRRALLAPRQAGRGHPGRRPGDRLRRALGPLADRAADCSGPGGAAWRRPARRRVVSRHRRLDAAMARPRLAGHAPRGRPEAVRGRPGARAVPGHAPPGFRRPATLRLPAEARLDRGLGQAAIGEPPRRFDGSSWGRPCEGRDQGRARSRQARAAPCPDARPDAARSAHPTGARPEPAGRRSGGGRGRPARAGGAAGAVLGVLRGADPRAQRGTARALRRGGRRLRARRRALPRRAVGRDRPQPCRAGAGAGGRRAEDPRRRRRPGCDRAAGSLAVVPTGSTIRTPTRCSRPGGQV